MYRKLIKAIGLESRPECVLYGRAKGELQIGITNRRKADDMFSVVVSSKLQTERYEAKCTQTTQPSLKAPTYGCFGRKLLKGLGDRGHFLILSVTLKRSVVKKKGGKRQIQNYKNIHVHVCNFSLLYIILRLKISKII